MEPIDLPLTDAPKAPREFFAWAMPRLRREGKRAQHPVAQAHQTGTILNRIAEDRTWHSEGGFDTWDAFLGDVYKEVRYSPITLEGAVQVVQALEEKPKDKEEEEKDPKRFTSKELVSNFPAGLPALATLFLQAGQCVAAAVHATDRLFTERGQVVYIRPSLLWPGGETWRHVGQ